MLRDNRGQVFMLIEILVVAAIILTAGYFMATNYVGHGGKSKPGEPATPTERAHGVDCANNLRQIRFAFDIIKTEEDAKLPETLPELIDKQGMSKSMGKCPNSGKDYVYDPAQPAVRCTTPGHEKY